MIVERTVQNFLNDGIQTLLSESLLFSHMLQGLGYAESEAAEVIEFWTNANKAPHKGAPSVHQGYPHVQDESRFPGYFITLTGESEDVEFLGESLGEVVGPNTETIPTLGGHELQVGEALEGNFTTINLTVLVIGQQADLVIANYHILKYLIHAGKNALYERGALTVRTSGADMAPNKQWIPNGFFARALSLNIQQQVCYRVSDGEGRAWQLDGAFVNRNASPLQDDSVGDVRTNVDAYTEE